MFTPTHPKTVSMALITGMAISSAVMAADPEQVIVVTASRTPQSADKALAAVTVITRKDIERSQAPSLLEVLRLHAGIDISRSGGKGTGTSLFIRGTNSNHVLVLIDGVRAGSATTGKTALEFIPLGQIQRIEIVRGPRAALYGSDAVGGVVLITTRKLRRTTTELRTGSFGNRELRMGTGGGKRLRYSLNAGIEKQTGFSASNPRAGSFTYDADKDGFETRNLSLRLSGAVGEKGQLSLKLMHSRSEVEYDKGVSESTNRVASLRFTHLTTGNWTQTLTLGSTLDDLLTRSSNPSLIITHRVSLDWQNDLRLGGNGKLSLGVNLYRDRGTNDNPTTGARTFGNTIYNRALFASWLKQSGRHNLQLSLRHDRHSQFGSKTTGLVAWGVQLSKVTRLWASAGTAFKAPTLNDLYHPGFSFGYAGNPNLQPETSKNLEIGIKRYMGRGQRLEVTLFSNRIRNLITYASTSPYQATNIGLAKIRGVELVYALRLADWRWLVNATWQQARNGDNGKTLLRRPDRKLTLTGTRKIGDHGDLSVEWLLVGHHEDYVGFSQGRVGGYGLVNLSGRYRIGKAWRLGWRLENLFDKSYQQVYGYNTPGRSFYLSLRHTL